ncbi:MAG TPA: hypothetical protein VFY42_02900, partial [Gemmatimonadales bacterium]|nr:hypothetical protein [Gemmatimonadales bacterium]
MPVFRALGWAPWLLVSALACSPRSDPSPERQPAPPPQSETSGSLLKRSELHASPSVQDPVGLRVVYPGPTDVVRVRDSSFLLGSVASGNTRLTIDGHRVRVWPNGAWLAWIPFPPDTVMQFRIEARTATDSSVLLYP